MTVALGTARQTFESLAVCWYGVDCFGGFARRSILFVLPANDLIEAPLLDQTLSLFRQT